MPESVWDYPRPPRVEPAGRRIRIVHAGTVLADTDRALRVLETSHPPTYYLPPEEILAGALEPAGGRTTVCEWKGAADYLDVVVGGVRLDRAAWRYRTPRSGFEQLRDHVAFYASALDECWVDDERVLAQDGVFYGGWVTSDLVGPFKGGPGTAGW